MKRAVVNKGPEADGRIALLLDLLDRGFERKSWHGTNLLGSIRGIVPKVAAWRPDEGRNSIWDLTVHAAYWKYAVRRRLSEEQRGSFPLKGSNWFPMPEPLSAAQWKEAVDLLRDEHAQMRAVVAALPPERLDDYFGKEWRATELIEGAAFHDIYHAGQIGLVKKLYAAGG